MEGIETDFLDLGHMKTPMSVGAPTWRGLKLVKLHKSIPVRCMSVGAPTWRGLKLSLFSLNGWIDYVSRCPDMEGIETCHMVTSVISPIMSVGAPTWRGLKQARLPR